MGIERTREDDLHSFRAEKVIFELVSTDNCVLNDEFIELVNSIRKRSIQFSTGRVQLLGWSDI